MDASDITLIDERLANPVASIRSAASTGPSCVAEVVDLATLLEALVLYDRPVIRLQTALPREYVTNSSVLAPFLEAGVLTIQRYENEELQKLLTLPAPPPDDAGLRFHMHMSVDHVIHAGQSNARYVPAQLLLPAECERILNLAIGELTEDIRRGDPEADPIELAGYIAALPVIRAIRSSAESSDPLLRSYQAWSSAAQRELQLLSDWGKPIPLVVPPIAAIVFEAARDLESVGRVALDLRHDLEGYRQKLREYSRAIRDDGVPLSESLAAAHRLQAGTAALTTQRDFSIVNLINFPEVIAATGAWFSGAGGLLATAKLVAAKPLEKLLEYLRRRDAMFVAALSDRFRQIRSYSSNVERLTGKSLVESDYVTAKRWFSEMQTWTATSSDESAINPPAS
jgi:hypothetical protein